MRLYNEIAINCIDAQKKISEICDIVRANTKFQHIVHKDIGDCTPKQVQIWLLQLLVPKTKVDIYWPSSRVGISLLFSEFVRYYDDLWYPGSDDIWIVQHGVVAEDYKWLIEFDHEELVSFWY